MSRLVTVAATIAFAGIAVACSGSVETGGGKAPAKKTPDGGTTPMGGDPGLGGPVPTPGPGIAPPGQQPPAGGPCSPKAPQSLQVRPWRPPTQLHRASCTTQDAQALATCYTTGQQCDVQVEAECHQCAVTDMTVSQQFGPILFNPNAGLEGVELNVEGCVAAMQGDTSAQGCGPKVMIQEACENQSCSACQDTTGAGQKACVESAATSVCKNYVTDAQACAQYVQQCKAGSDLVQIATNLVSIFCM